MPLSQTSLYRKQKIEQNHRRICNIKILIVKKSRLFWCVQQDIHYVHYLSNRLLVFIVSFLLTHKLANQSLPIMNLDWPLHVATGYSALSASESNTVRFQYQAVYFQFYHVGDGRTNVLVSIVEWLWRITGRSSWQLFVLWRIQQGIFENLGHRLYAANEESTISSA